MAKKPQHPAPAKAVCSRAGTTRDNSAARAFFALPPLALANTTAVTAPAALPVQQHAQKRNSISAQGAKHGKRWC